MDEEWSVHEPSPGGYRFDPLSYRVIGAATDVHRQLRPGFREELYENALCIEFDTRNICYRRQVPIAVHYDGHEVGMHGLDLVVESSLVLELKAVSCLLDVHAAQLLAYLRAADAPAGLLLNFGEMPLKVKRLVNNYRG